MGKRGGNRGPKIKPNIKALIRITAREDKRGRRAVALALRDLIERLGEVVPGEETLLQMISEERNKDPNPEDQPWHMGTLDEYPLSPEGLRAVIEAHWFAARHEATLTNREAKWIGRLCAVPKMFPKLSDKDTTPFLISLGCEYAAHEVWAEASGGPFKPLIPGNPEFPIENLRNSEHWEAEAAGCLERWKPDSEQRSIAALKKYFQSPGHKKTTQDEENEDRRTDPWHLLKEQNPKLGKRLGRAWHEAERKRDEIHARILEREDKHYTERDWAALESVWEEVDRLLDSHEGGK